MAEGFLRSPVVVSTAPSAAEAAMRAYAASTFDPEAFARQQARNLAVRPVAGLAIKHNN